MNTAGAGEELELCDRVAYSPLCTRRAFIVRAVDGYND